MPKIGDGFIEIHPDWSAFGAGFNEEVKARLKAAAEEIKAKISLDVDKSPLAAIGRDISNIDFSSAFSGLRREAARPIEQKVDLDYHTAFERLRLALGHATQNIHVDVDRDSLTRMSGSISNALGSGFQGATAGLSGVLSRIPVIGGLFQGLSSAFGTTALGAAAASTAIIGLVGVLAALAASLGAALAGLGALTIAFGAALGPAVLVAFAAIARFVNIVKAVKDHNDNASTSARGVAAANDQLRAATEAVANAQSNVREQSVAAYQAWATAIENVHDDLLAVDDAQQGITDANLTTREAQQALVDYQKSIHAAGDTFDQVFKKFTDVNVDTSGLKKALLGAADTSGTDLTADQELKLERLINNVRDAKLGERHATDSLKDSKRKLNEDTKTEVDFAHRGVAAYKPYRDALKQVDSAQRQVASAQRASASASERQTKAFDKLTPAEQKFGTVLIGLGKTLNAVFTPVMAALLDGVTRGLQSFTSAATDPKIGKALTDTGKALGDAFASIAKTLTSPEMRQAFADFADAGVRIISTFGTHVFEDLAKILGRIAEATLPLLIPLLDKVTGFFDGLERSSRNRKNLQDDISHLVDVFKDWASFIGAVSTDLLNIGRFLEPIGTGIVKFLTHPLGELSTTLGASKDDVRAFSAVFRPLQRVAAVAIGGVLDTFRGLAQQFRGILRIIGGVLTLNFREIWTGIKDVFRGGVRAIKGIVEVAISPFKAIGKRLGEGLINALISAVNLGIRALNKILGPHDLGPLGTTPDLRLGEIDKIGGASGVDIKKRGASKGPASRGDAGRFTIRSAAVQPFAGAPLAGAAIGGGVIIEQQDVHLPPAPGAAIPDARFQAAQFAREIAKRR